jgi:hypothetical protein
VKFEIVNLMKRFGTNAAFVFFGTRMSKLMVFIVALLMKTFATIFAYPWLVVLVNAHVSIESRTTIECFAA